MKSLFPTIFALLFLFAGAPAAVPELVGVDTDLPADPVLRFGRLENGMRYVVMANKEPRERVALRLLVEAGSLHETEEQRGLAHFLEHMIFKGTNKRSPLKIAQSLESLGGNLNAFTGKEVTCYFANTLDSHLKNSVEVLADIVCHSTFPEKR